MAISLVDTNANVYSVATSQNATVPATAAVGDLLLAFVMHRDTLTLPAGWSTVDSQVCSNGVTPAHYLTLAKKVCAAPDIGASTTWTQATSQRISVEIMVWRGNGVDVAATAISFVNNNTGNSHTLPALSTTASGQAIVVGATSILGANATFSLPAGYTITTANNVADLRMGVGYQLPTHPFTTSGSASFSYSPANNGWVIIAARLEEFVPTVTSISPTNGSVAGGTNVTITGTKFTGATEVKIGGVTATSLVVVNDTTITCITGAHAEGLVNVDVTTPYGTGTGTNLYQYGDVDTRVTQVPIFVLDNANQAVRVTQLPVLFLSLPIQPVRVTQLPILVANLPKPLPIPGPIVPEVPVTETWSWKTTVNISDKGTEQRSATRSAPRISMEFDGIIYGSVDRQTVYQMLFDYIKKVFSYPLYAHSTKLTAVTTAGTAKLYFDPAATDMRAGEAIALFDPYLEKTQLATILTVDIDGATLTANVSADLPVYTLVCPVSSFSMRQSVGLKMDSVSGDFSLKIDGAELRTVLRPNQALNLLTLVDGLLVLDKFPLADNSADENMTQNVSWLDNEISRPQPNTLWPVPYINGTRQYLIHRPFGMDYWRSVGDYLKGRQKPFLLPTFFDDLPLAVQPALNATTIKSTNVSFFGFWRSKAYRYIRIHSKAGIIYRRILEVTANYDVVTQEPVTIDIKLSASIGGGVGANEIIAISYCNTARFNSDDMVFEHGEVDSILSIKIRTIEE